MQWGILLPTQNDSESAEIIGYSDAN
jgi:hypothetical protein